MFFFLQGKFIRINFDASGFISGANIESCILMELVFRIQELKRGNYVTQCRQYFMVCHDGSLIQWLRQEVVEI